VMSKVSYIETPTLEEYYESDGEARTYAADLISL
jgi:1-deoxy-D-xylulose-5-phosphate reductoisomerase